MAPTTATHDQLCRAHAIGCVLENLSAAARRRVDGRAEILASNPIVVGDGYLQDGTATCYCGTDMGWALPWTTVAVGILVLNAAAPAPVANLDREPEQKLDALSAKVALDTRTAALTALAKLYAEHPDAPPPVASVLVAAVRLDPWAPRGDLTVKSPGHERFYDGRTSSGWAIWWESGPDEWAFADTVSQAADGSGLFVEPINSWSVGIYPA
jgi:hypothetical protein